MRDLTDKQFTEAMKLAGWTKPEFGFLGYWQHRSGLHASTWNYHSNRVALARMTAMGDDHERRKAEAQAARDAKETTRG